MSHPLRVRGLKQGAEGILSVVAVASFTGAWIETQMGMEGYGAFWGRILYGCVD